jgi:hypothetical protein
MSIMQYRIIGGVKEYGDLSLGHFMLRLLLWQLLDGQFVVFFFMVGL